MAVYEYQDGAWRWTEQHLYGAECLGVHYTGEDWDAATSNPAITPVPGSTTTANGLFYETNPNVFGMSQPAFKGRKNYELINHLGNVMAVINDLPIIDQGLVFQLADVVTATDYIPACAERSRIVGLEMPGRMYSASDYSFAFNGKINDEEILPNGRWQDYGFRAHRNDICWFVSVDPLKDKYPELTTYQFASNTPICAIDLDGLERTVVIGWEIEQANGGVSLNQQTIEYSPGEEGEYQRWIYHKLDGTVITTIWTGEAVCKTSKPFAKSAQDAFVLSIERCVVPVTNVVMKEMNELAFVGIEASVSVTIVGYSSTEVTIKNWGTQNGENHTAIDYETTLAAGATGGIGVPSFTASFDSPIVLDNKYFFCWSDTPAGTETKASAVSKIETEFRLPILGFGAFYCQYDTSEDEHQMGFCISNSNPTITSQAKVGGKASFSLDQTQTNDECYEQ